MGVFSKLFCYAKPSVVVTNHDLADITAMCNSLEKNFQNADVTAYMLTSTLTRVLAGPVSEGIEIDNIVSRMMDKEAKRQSQLAKTAKEHAATLQRYQNLKKTF